MYKRCMYPTLLFTIITDNFVNHLLYLVNYSCKSIIWVYKSIELSL